jgi:hypothetical protein
MSIEEVSPEQFEELFHHYHQALRPEVGHAAKFSTETWEHVPPQERNRLVAAARLALLELNSRVGEQRVGERVGEQKQSRRYFAKPGEAEWGC